MAGRLLIVAGALALAWLSESEPLPVLVVGLVAFSLVGS